MTGAWLPKVRIALPSEGGYGLEVFCRGRSPAPRT